MTTPKNAPYKKTQRKAEDTARNKGKALWVSSLVVSVNPLIGELVKRHVQGIYNQAIHGELKRL